MGVAVTVGNTPVPGITFADTIRITCATPTMYNFYYHVSVAS